MSLLKKNKTFDQSVEKILRTDFAENCKVKLKLNGSKMIFDDGEWKNGNLL